MKKKPSKNGKAPPHQGWGASELAHGNTISIIVPGFEFRCNSTWIVSKNADGTTDLTIVPSAPAVGLWQGFGQLVTASKG